MFAGCKVNWIHRKHCNTSTPFSFYFFYTWRGKHPWVKNSGLHKSKHNFQYYYWASNICWTRFWFNFQFLLKTHLSWQYLDLHFPWPPLSHLIIQWWGTHTGETDCSPLSPVSPHYVFQPSLSDSVFQDWCSRCFVSFMKLSETFNLLHTNLLRELQIRHFVQSQMSYFQRLEDGWYVPIFVSISERVNICYLWHAGCSPLYF